MARRRKRWPAANDTSERLSPGEAAAPRGPHIQEVKTGGTGRLEAANDDDAIHAVARRTGRVARLLSWVAVVAVAGVVVVIVIAYA